MENLQFKYAGIGHSMPGGRIMFKLERGDGGQFGVVLTVKDAALLLDDLKEQVRIAAENSN